MSRVVATYLRVSSEEQAASGLGLADQGARTRAYVDALGLAVGAAVESFTDAGESAASLDRPALAVLRARIRRREVSAVVVLKLDRLTRSLRDLLDLVEELTRAGVALHSVTERIDTASSAGRMMLAMLGAVAEWEREQISERTRAAVAAKRRQGLAHGFARYGERVVAGRLESVEGELEVIGRIIRARAAGESLHSIARSLNAEGVPTARGGAWHAATVRGVIARAS